MRCPRPLAVLPGPAAGRIYRCDAVDETGPPEDQSADHQHPYREGQRHPHVEIAQDQQSARNCVREDDKPARHQKCAQPDRRQRDHEHGGHPQRIGLTQSDQQHPTKRRNLSMCCGIDALRGAVNQGDTHCRPGEGHGEKQQSAPDEYRGEEFVLQAAETIADHADEPQERDAGHRNQQCGDLETGTACVDPLGTGLCPRRQSGPYQDQCGPEEHREQHARQCGGSESRGDAIPSAPRQRPWRHRGRGWTSRKALADLPLKYLFVGHDSNTTHRVHVRAVTSMSEFERPGHRIA